MFKQPICSYSVASKVRIFVGKQEYSAAYFNTERNINETDIVLQTSKNVTKFSVSFETGVGATIDIFERLLTIQISSLSSFINKTRGLLGVNNNNINDDFTRPDGKTIPINSTQSEIYHTFGTKCE